MSAASNALRCAFIPRPAVCRGAESGFLRQQAKGLPVVGSAACTMAPTPRTNTASRFLRAGITSSAAGSTQRTQIPASGPCHPAGPGGLPSVCPQNGIVTAGNFRIRYLQPHGGQECLHAFLKIRRGAAWGIHRLRRQMSLQELGPFMACSGLSADNHPMAGHEHRVFRWLGRPKQRPSAFW